MKNTKIFLFILLGFFLISIGSANAGTGEGSVIVTVTPRDGGWTVWNPIDCPNTPGSPASVQTRSCTNPVPAGVGAKDCVGPATSACPAIGKWSTITKDDCPKAEGSKASTLTATCKGPGDCIDPAPTIACPAVEITPTGSWSYPDPCPSAAGSASVNQKETCTGGNLKCSGTAQTRTCPAIGTWSIGECSTECGKEATTLTATCTGPGTCIDPAPTKNCLKTKECPPEVCSTPLTKTVTVQCDVNANGDTATSGLVTRSQTKSDYPQCTFGSPVTTLNSTYVSDDCVYPPKSCSTPLTKTVTVQCDVNANGDTATSGLVTRSQTKSDYPQCTFGSPVTTLNSTYVSDDCVYPPKSCSTPLTKTVTVQCDVNANGDTATSGLVTRSQTKSDYPQCTFGSPVTTLNSTYVSDDCVYPPATLPLPAETCSDGIKNQNETGIDTGGVCIKSCIDPQTKDITGIACDKNEKGEDAISGSVTRRQTKVAPSCTFGTPVTVDNSEYVSDTCKYPEGSPVSTCSNGAVNPECTIDAGGSCINGAKNPSTCTIDAGGSCINGAQNPSVCNNFAVIDGGWSNWSQRTNCPGSGTQTRTCTNPTPSGVGAKSCAGESSREYIADECPSLDVSFTYNNKTLLPGKMIPYNSKAKVIWNSKNVESCSYSSKDSTGKILNENIQVETNSSLMTPFLKKNTTYEITCGTIYLETISVSVTIPVDKINAGYIER